LPDRDLYREGNPTRSCRLGRSRQAASMGDQGIRPIGSVAVCPPFDDDTCCRLVLSRRVFTVAIRVTNRAVDSIDDCRVRGMPAPCRRAESGRRSRIGVVSWSGTGGAGRDVVLDQRDGTGLVGAVPPDGAQTAVTHCRAVSTVIL